MITEFVHPTTGFHCIHILLFPRPESSSSLDISSARLLLWHPCSGLPNSSLLRSTILKAGFDGWSAQGSHKCLMLNAYSPFTDRCPGKSRSIMLLLSSPNPLGAAGRILALPLQLRDNPGLSEIVPSTFGRVNLRLNEHLKNIPSLFLIGISKSYILEHSIVFSV